MVAVVRCANSATGAIKSVTRRNDIMRMGYMFCPLSDIEKFSRNAGRITKPHSESSFLDTISSEHLVRDNDGRGRDFGCPKPPAQIRTSGFPAYGSYLGYVASKLLDARLPNLGTPVPRSVPDWCGSGWRSP